MDQDLKDKNKSEKKDLINLVKNKESFHLNSLITGFLEPDALLGSSRLS